VSNFTVSYLFRLRDQFTAQARKIGSTSQSTRKQVHQLGQSVNRLEAAVRANTAAMAQQAAQTRAAGNAAGQARRQYDGLARSIRRARTFGHGAGAGGLLGGIGGGMGAFAGTRGVKQYADYETSLMNIRKVWTGTEAEYQKIVAGLTKLNQTMPLSRGDLAMLAEEGIRANVAKDAEGIVAYTQQVARFATAFTLPIAEASTVLAKLRSQLDMTSGEFEALGDLMNTVANNFSLSEKEILETLRRQAGLAKSIAGKQGITDFVSLSAAQLAVGTPREVAATGMRTLLARLSTQPKGTQDALKKLGLNPEYIKKQLPKDLFGTVREVLRRVAALPESERAGTLAELAGMKSFDAFSRLLGNVGMIDQVRKVVEGTDRLTMSDEFARRLTTLNAALQITANTLADFFDSLVAYWRPTIDSALAGIQDLTKSLKGNPWLAWGAGIFMAASALGLLLFPLGMLAFTLKLLAPALMLILGLLSKVAYAILVNFLGAFVGLGVAGTAMLAGLGAAVWVVYDNWKAITEGIPILWDKALNGDVTGIVVMWASAMQSTIKSLLKIPDGIFGTDLANQFEQAMNALPAIAARIVEQVKTAFASLKAYLSSLIPDWMKSALTYAIPGASMLRAQPQGAAGTATRAIPESSARRDDLRFNFTHGFQFENPSIRLQLDKGLIGPNKVELPTRPRGTAVTTNQPGSKP
jgi:TP901 family phage tail tape measure protein